MTRRTAAWLLLGIVLLGAGARSYRLTARSLWFDEAFSWRLTQFPVREMLDRAAQDVHPPLYYLMLKAWRVVFFGSLLSLRMFSVTWAAVSIALSYLVAASVTRSRAAGLLGAMLIALSGFQMQYAWDARMYTLGIALALLACWLLLKAIRTARLSWWLTYALAAAAFAYVHYFAVFTLSAHFLFVLGYLVIRTRGRLGEILLQRQTWWALLAAAVVITLYVPWLPRALEQNARVQSAYWVPPIGAWSIPDTFYRMLIPTSAIPSHRGIGALLSALPLIAVAVVLWLITRTRTAPGRDGRVLLALSILIPFVGVILISLLSHSLYQDRFFAFVHPFLILAIAVLTMMIKPRRLRTASAAVLLVGFLVASLNYWQELDIRHRPGALAAARLIAQQRAPDEPVLVSSPFIFFPLDFYFTESFAAPRAVKLYTASASLQHFAGAPILVPDDLLPPDFLRQTLAESLWVVDTTGFGAEPLHLTADWLPVNVQSYPEVFAYQGTVTVTRYLRHP